MMFLRKVTGLHRSQAGYTLIEVLAVIAISGIIALGATMANVQVITQTSRNNDITAANAQVLNAIHFISRDVQMAQSVNGTSRFDSANLTISWETWDHISNQVVYYVDNTSLKRIHTVGGAPPRELVIARNIDPTQTSAIWDPLTRALTLTITVRTGEGSHAITIRKEKGVVPRPQL